MLIVDFLFMDYSHFHNKTLYIDCITHSHEGRVRERSLRKLEIVGGTVTSYLQVTPNLIRSCTYEGWFVEKFVENTAKASFDLQGKCFTPDYIVTHTVEINR